jgi:hypothetical protein
MAFQSFLHLCGRYILKTTVNEKHINKELIFHKRVELPDKSVNYRHLFISNVYILVSSVMLTFSPILGVSAMSSCYWPHNCFEVRAKIM